MQRDTGKGRANRPGHGMNVTITSENGAGGEHVYVALRQSILSLALQPGAELEEGILSRRFCVSRTPVREALIRLSSEGLVTLQRGRGARVAPLDLRNLRDLFEGLDVLQRATTRLAASRRLEAELTTIEHHMLAFEAAAARLDSGAVNDANYAFHLAIGEAAHSQYVGSAYRRVMTEGLRVAHLCYSENTNCDRTLTDHLNATAREHREMLRAIRERDADAAEHVAGGHVVLFKERVTKMLISPGLTERIDVTIDR